MNSFLDEPDDPRNDFVTALATDPSVPEKARHHLARWVSRWRQAGGEESEAATMAFFEELGRSPILEAWQKPRGPEVFWSERSETPSVLLSLSHAAR